MSTQTQTSPSPELARLAAMLMQLDDLLITCMRCGFCMSVCPVYGATMQEADVTRGKIALLRNLAFRMIRNPESVNDKLGRCLLCGSCQANCPSGVKIMDIYLHARAIVTGYLGLSTVKKLIFRGILRRPGLFNALLGLSRPFQGLFLKKSNQAAETYRAPMLKTIIGDRHLPKLASTPFHSSRPCLNTPAGKSGLRAAFFPGCVSDKIFPGVAEASVKALQKHEVGIFIPQGQYCCGVPALASGERTAYNDMVRRNLGLFSSAPFDYLLTPCGTCTATIKEFWPKLMEGYSADEQARIKELNAKTMDISAFLVDVLKIKLPDAQGGDKVVTYHDSCHLKKSLGVSTQPRSLLKALPGFQFAEMPEADRCCGSGGSFTLMHYDLSGKIGQRKRDNIAAVKADTVAAGCPACMMQLKDMLARNNDNVAVRHVIELYADTL
ncbi:MAG: (Fe-S)-binding protein [Deltaproteobacteria bacterium]|jgi:glycolate oxidase iron-sulfur subunit|nr:(Fe-S)-binding protein [Deltaproteobacteria bacterium]